MGLLSNRISRSKVKAGDHIYTWRGVYAYSHHGIYVGDEKVVHFTQVVHFAPEMETPSGSNPYSSSSPSSNISSASRSNPYSSSSSSSNIPSASRSNPYSSSGPSSNISSASRSNPYSSSSSSSNILSASRSNPYSSSGPSSNIRSACKIPDCGSQQQDSGIILSCLDCFLGNGSLYKVEYGVSYYRYLAQVRGGTCTMAKSDPPEKVIHRAMVLLRNGFGTYDLFRNNCEDFAIYCKTELSPVMNLFVSRSGQASMIHDQLNAICWTPVLMFVAGPPLGIAMTATKYCLSRYDADIGARQDVVKVAVEDLVANLEKKRIMLMHGFRLQTRSVSQLSCSLKSNGGLIPFSISINRETDSEWIMGASSTDLKKSP